MKNFDNVTIFNHPLVNHKIAILRDEKTSMKEFRELIEEITTLMTFECLKEEGVTAVAYMPTRNTPAQLERLRALCDQYTMFQISGEDINSPRQSFIIKAMENPMFQNLIDATWKLIQHEEETL